MHDLATFRIVTQVPAVGLFGSSLQLLAVGLLYHLHTLKTRACLTTKRIAALPAWRQHYVATCWAVLPIVLLGFKLPGYMSGIYATWLPIGLQDTWLLGLENT